MRLCRNNNLNPVSRCVALVQVWLTVRPASHFLPFHFRLVYWASPDRNVKVCWEWRLSRNTPNLYSCLLCACGLCVIHVCAHACLCLQLLHHIVELHNAPMCVICVYEVLVISKKHVSSSCILYTHTVHTCINVFPDIMCIRFYIIIIIICELKCLHIYTVWILKYYNCAM